MSTLLDQHVTTRKKMNNGNKITWSNLKDTWIRPYYDGSIAQFARDILGVSESTLFQWINKEKEVTDIERDKLYRTVSKTKESTTEIGREKLAEILHIDNSKSAVQTKTSYSSINIGGDEGKDALIKLQEKRIQELEELIELYKKLLEK